MSLLLATIASPLPSSLCTESGAYCVRPLTGYLCTDSPTFCDTLIKTSANISPLYQLDAFDWTVLVLYFGILTVLAIYGVYRVKQVIDFWRYSRFPPKPRGEFAASELPQLSEPWEP